MEAKATPFKQREIENCGVCGKGLAERPSVTFFYRFKVEQFILDGDAIQRHHGLELALGSAQLAAVMGPDRPIAHGMGESSTLVCGTCLLNGCRAASVWESAVSDGGAK